MAEQQGFTSQFQSAQGSMPTGQYAMNNNMNMTQQNPYGQPQGNMPINIAQYAMNNGMMNQQQPPPPQYGAYPNQMGYNQYQQPMQQQVPQGMHQQLQQLAAAPPPPQQNIEDKNAAYLARMRAKQAKKREENAITNDFGDEPKKVIDLFGGNNDGLQKASIAFHKKKKKSKFVTLPDTGLTEKELFGKYRIESADKIGAGAFARIKIIKDKSSGKQYALKMVKKKGKSKADIEAFKKEILFLSKLTNHPNIIRLYDFCDSPQGLYMVLEYCNGGDVMQKMEQCKTFKEPEAKHLTKQIVAGLCYFHQYNIVHRDLKLDNLMYSNGVLKIIDFGLAGDCTDTALNTPCGTLHFTAPEVLSSYDYTTKADMWSLGIIIYMFICGFPPFLDTTGNQQKLFQLIKRGKFQFMNSFFGKCHPSIKDMITRLLCKQPGQRLSAEQARNHEWLTGIKQEPMHQMEVVNPFLDQNQNNNNNNNQPQQMAPYQQYYQQQYLGKNTVNGKPAPIKQLPPNTNQGQPGGGGPGGYQQQQRRVSTTAEKTKEQIRRAYRDYGSEKGKIPTDVQSFVSYCKNKKNVKKANWTYCQGVMEEMSQMQQNQNQMNNQGQFNNYGGNGFQGQSGGFQSNDYDNNGWQQQQPQYGQNDGNNFGYGHIQNQSQQGFGGMAPQNQQQSGGGQGNMGQYGMNNGMNMTMNPQNQYGQPPGNNNDNNNNMGGFGMNMNQQQYGGGPPGGEGGGFQMPYNQYPPQQQQQQPQPSMQQQQYNNNQYPPQQYGGGPGGW